jgi:hypothetical protein
MHDGGLRAVRNMPLGVGTSAAWRRFGSASAFLLVGALALAATSSTPSPIELESLFSLGQLDGSDHEVFGLVEAVGTDPEGRILIVDSRLAALRVFSVDGRSIGSVARRGRGPGELAHPVDLSVDPGGRVHVLDPENARVSIYSIADDAVGFDSSFRLPFHGESLCHVGERLFVRGFHGGRLIHEVDPARGVVASFGRLPAQEDVASDALAGGPVACGVGTGRSEGLVVTASRFRPEIQAYRADGTPAWSHLLEGFEPIVIEVPTPGAVTLRQPEGGFYHVITEIRVLPSGRVLVQFGARTPEVRGRQEITAVESRVLTPTGEVEWASRTVPRLGATDESRAYAIENLPFPKVEVYRFKEG